MNLSCHILDCLLLIIFLFSFLSLFQCRKHKDLYLWMVKCPSGPSVKFLVNAGMLIFYFFVIFFIIMFSNRLAHIIFKC